MNSTSKTHYSCAELAAMKLPGMPTTERRMRDLVERESWEFTEIKSAGRSGMRREYLPPAKIARLIEARSKIAADGSEARAIQAALAQVRSQIKAEKAQKSEVKEAEIRAALSLTGQQKFDAHFDIVLAFRDYFNAGAGLKRKAAFNEFAERYNAGKIKISKEVRDVFSKISARSIERWVLDNEKHGLVACADKRAVTGGSGERKSIIEQHPEIEKFFIAVITEKPHIQNTHLTEVLNELRIAKFGDQPTGEIYCGPINYSAVCRYRSKFEKQHKQALMAETNPDAWKNKFMSSMGSQDEAVRYLNQLWLMDGTPADWDLIDGRHTASVVLDVWSRRPKILFSKTPRTETNKLLLRAAVLDWGVCDNAKVDNGTDYVSREMAMFFEEMGIDSSRCNAFSPWEKGHVERFIKTYLHSILEVLDNFVGHNVADKKVLDARRSFADNLFKKNAVVKVEMTCAELQKLSDAWVAGTYMMDVHRGLDMTPLQRVASYTGAVKRISNERALDILLAKPLKKLPTITKTGIRFDKAEFIHAELPLHVGELADIRLDPNDMGKIIVYVGGKFLCIASNAMLEGIDRAEVAAHGKALQNAMISEKKAEFKKARKTLPTTLHQLAINMITDRAEKAGKVTVLAKRAEEHRTAALLEAEQVLKAQETPQPSAAYLQLMAEAKQMMIDQLPKAPVLRLPDSTACPLDIMNEKEKFTYWHELDALVKGGGEITSKRIQVFYTKFNKSTAFKAQQKMQGG